MRVASAYDDLTGRATRLTGGSGPVEALERMLGARYVADVDTLMAEADILTLHCPLTDETRHMVDARRIALMKPGSSIVNTARGELIDQEALIAALESGHLAGAGETLTCTVACRVRPAAVPVTVTA